MSQGTFLIVQQQINPPQGLPELLVTLNREHGLDAYSCRQCLIGQGISLLHKGNRENLQQISNLLTLSAFRHWLIDPTKPRFAPAAISSLQKKAAGVNFTCQNQQVLFPAGARVLAVLADLSGQLAEQSIKQLMASHAYQGADNRSHISREKTYKTILQGTPVLDLYLFDETNNIIAAVRVFPGKFDHRGLGDRATASSRQNLHQLLEMSRENAGDFHLETGFGLDNLPGCQLQKPIDENPDVLRKNLVSLTRYGWLMADLQRLGEVVIEKDVQKDVSETLGAALLAGYPDLTATGEPTEILPSNGEIAKQLNQTTTAHEDRPASQERPKTRTLPTPPPVQTGHHWRTPRFWFGSIGGILAVAMAFLFEQLDALPSLVRYGFQMGIFPALIGALMFWGGFHYLRLKRLVENTPTSKIRSVAMGMVEIKGKAIRQYALLAPMTHSPCTWYRLTRYRRDKNRNWAVSSVSSSGGVPFLLEDDTGRISIDPNGATVRAKTRQEGVPGQSSLLFGSGIGDSDLSEKWVEELIYEGTVLYILGFAAVKKTGGSSLREKKVNALRDLKRDPQRMHEFDLDGDGQISETEWETARAAVEDQVLTEELAGRDRRRRQEEQISVCRPTGGRPFIIAETRSEAHLTTRFALYTVPLFLGATICTGWAIALLVKWLT